MCCQIRKYVISIVFGTHYLDIFALSIFFLSILCQYSAIIEFRYKERKEEFNLLSVFLFIFSFCCMQFVHNEQF